MKDETVEDLSLEPERYELYAEVEERWEKARGEFFAHTGVGGIVVVFALDEVPAMHEASGRRGGPGVSLPQEIGVWLHIGENGMVTGYTGKVEVGQNIRTSLSQIIADELPVPLASIQLVMGDTDLSPFDFGTVGSRTTPVVAPQFRAVAASAREALLDLAAERTGAARTHFFMEESAVRHRETAQIFSVATLVRDHHLLKVVGADDNLAKPRGEWRIGDAPVSKINGRALVTGKHRYTSDLARPGMAYGKVLRSPSAPARRVSLDTSAAEALPGVTVVCDGDFTGVVAPDELTATRALNAIRAEWEPATDQPNADGVFDYFKNNLSEAQGYGGSNTHTEGSVADGIASASHTLAATYTAAYIAHVPLEPRAAVAEWSDDNPEARTLTVWTGTQRPFGVRTELAQAFGLSENHIRVIVPDTGSGYGGKHTGDAAIEAARLARVAGKPVKIVWTREEEFTSAYLRPAGVVDIHSGVDANGALTAWEYHNFNSGASGMRTLYTVPHQHTEFHAARSPLRQGSYRALAATFNHFARETHMDELAHAVHTDPLAFRLSNLEDERLRDVLTAAAARFDWGDARPAGHGVGIAGGHEKGSYVATCAEVSVDQKTGAVKVVRAVTAFECGAIMSAENVRSQVEGAVIQGLGGALFEQIAFENGAIGNASFTSYRLPRFSDIPVLETVLLDRKDLPSVGAGETPIVAIAPAIGNAIFNATGVRLRSMPLAPNGVKTA